MAHRVFVFGSNLAGKHGAGSALEAKRRWGARQGVGVGRQGDSYAIPTKDYQLQPLPLHHIAKYVDQFLAYAWDHPTLTFDVVAIGTGLAGYEADQIRPMFDAAHRLPNVRLPREFR